MERETSVGTLVLDVDIADPAVDLGRLVSAVCWARLFVDRPAPSLLRKGTTAEVNPPHTLLL